MRRKRGTSLPINEPRFDVSSLVDISFLLLVFFLVTSTLLPKERDVNFAIPRPGSESPLAPPVVVKIRDDDSVVLHPGRDYEEQLVMSDEGRELPVLTSRVESLAATHQGVMLDVDDNAGYQRFIDVLEALRSGGLHEVAIVQR